MVCFSIIFFLRSASLAFSFCPFCMSALTSFCASSILRCRSASLALQSSAFPRKACRAFSVFFCAASFEEPATGTTLRDYKGRILLLACHNFYATGSMLRRPIHPECPKACGYSTACAPLLTGASRQKRFEVYENFCRQLSCSC